MSRILDQLKSARENKKAPLPNLDGTSLDTVIEYNTPRKSRRPSLKRLIIILCASIGFVLIAVFTALQLIAQNEHITPSSVSSAVQTTGQAGREVLAGSPSSKADWQKLASKELAAKKAETLPMEILSIESVDEGPVIEEIEIGPVPPDESEGTAAFAIEIEEIELGPAPAAHLEIEVVELEIIPVEEELEKAPAAVVEIKAVEPKPAPAAPPEIEVVELAPAPAPPKAVKPERAEPPHIEIKVKESVAEGVVVEGRAAEEATLVEAPPTIVMEEQEVSEAPLVPVSPSVPPKVTRAPRIVVKTTPQPVPAPEEPTKPSPPVKVFEDTTVEIPPPTVAKVPTPPAVVPAPAQPEEEMVFPQETLARREQFKRAVFYQKSGELKKARNQYLEIIKLDPMDPETHNNLGSIYQAWGDLNSAISEYRKALLIRPNYYKARNNLGVALYKQGNLQAALREFRIATNANPRDIQSLTNLGVISKKLEQPDRARQFFEKALSIDPSHAEAHYNLALILEEDEPVNAIFHYQKFLEYSAGQYPTLEEQVMQHLNSLTRKPWG